MLMTIYEICIYILRQLIGKNRCCGAFVFMDSRRRCSKTVISFLYEMSSVIDLPQTCVISSEDRCIVQVVLLDCVADSSLLVGKFSRQELW